MTNVRYFIAAVCALILAATVPVREAEAQKRETLAAWDEYVRLTEERIEHELASGDGFFSADFVESEQRHENYTTVRKGHVAIEKIETRRADGGEVPVPDGLVHHWRGAVFVPGVTLREVLDAVRDPERDTLQQDVLEARVLERTEDFVRVYLKLVRSKIVTAIYDTEHVAHYRRHGDTKASSRTTAIRISELADAGTPDEREKGIGEDRGFLWRLNSYWRYGEIDGGVLIECESLSLSRSIPFLARPFVGPIVDGVAKESLSRTLTGMRERLKDAA